MHRADHLHCLVPSRLRTRNAGCDRPQLLAKENGAAQIPELTHYRDYSQIERRTISGQPVYVKRCLPGQRYTTPELVEEQLVRVVSLLHKVAGLLESHSRLGALKVFELDATKGIISTVEVTGTLLSDAIRGRSSQAHRDTLPMAFFLAGRWARALQTIPISEDVPCATPTNPDDLVQHCDLRLEMLMGLGYSWPNERSREHVVQWLREQVDATPKDLVRRVWCHGDYGPFNMIWDGRRLTPIDFEASAPGLPLSDMVYLIYRLEMLPVEVPWRWWPVQLWRRACLRGYGMPDAERLPIYRVLMVRCLLSRLKNLVQRRSKTQLRHLHDQWCLRWVRARLVRLIGEPTSV